MSQNLSATFSFYSDDEGKGRKKESAPKGHKRKQAAKRRQIKRPKIDERDENVVPDVEAALPDRCSDDGLVVKSQGDKSIASSSESDDGGSFVDDKKALGGGGGGSDSDSSSVGDTTTSIDDDDEEENGAKVIATVDGDGENLSNGASLTDIIHIPDMLASEPGGAAETLSETGDDGDDGAAGVDVHPDEFGVDVTEEQLQLILEAEHQPTMSGDAPAVVVEPAAAAPQEAAHVPAGSAFAIVTLNGSQGQSSDDRLLMLASDVSESSSPMPQSFDTIYYNSSSESDEVANFIYPNARRQLDFINYSLEE